MTIKQKSEQYAKNVIDSFSDDGVPCSTKAIQQMIAEGYLSGAKEAKRKNKTTLKIKSNDSKRKGSSTSQKMG